MKRLVKAIKITVIVGVVLLGFHHSVQGQIVSPNPNPNCNLTVPHFNIDLTGNPDSTWVSPSLARVDLCCSASSPDRCVSFSLTLDPNAAGIVFEIIEGAVPPGALYYEISCLNPQPVDSVICISGVGPHEITFCKPGNNENIYRIRSISIPTFPEDTATRIGCSVPLQSYGFQNSVITWNSIYPGAPGAYNHYLDSLDVPVPLYTPDASAPPYVEYEVCGVPEATKCGFPAFCDIVRVYNRSALTGSIGPSSPSFCQTGTGTDGVTLTASSSGGGTSYSYEWLNSSGGVLGSGASYFASSAGNYTLAVYDEYYNATYCPAYKTTVSVTENQIPIVDAGNDTIVCATNPISYLDGNVQFSSGGTYIWTGGTGSFSPGSSFEDPSYTPSSNEINSNTATLTLTYTAPGGGCPPVSDNVTITIRDTVDVGLSASSLSCYNSVTTINSSVTGGETPYNYFWNTGAAITSINGGQGNYTLQITDNIGCVGNASLNVVAPSQINVVPTSSDATANGASDGEVYSTPSGGTPPYSFSWSSGQTTQNVIGLPYGVYVVTVTDANGCTGAASVVVNEPRCLSFNATATNDHLDCNGDSDGSSTVSVSGGSSPYAYTWDDPLTQTGSTATGLSAGTYTVTVTDANLCVQLATASVTQPSQITNTMNQTNVTTVSGSNGTASANPMGGTPGVTPAPDYTYIWDTGASNQGITNLLAGTYYVDIFDANSCTIKDSVLITEPPCNNMQVSVITNNVSCFGGSSGSATAFVNNAQPPYTISWSTGATGASISNLTAGNYTVTVTDARNCPQFKNFTIIEPSPLTVSLVDTDISCFGANDGTVETTVTGGTAPYTFNWNSGAYTSEDLSNLRPGTYTLNLTDANGCSASSTAAITSPTKLTVSYAVTPVTCYGYSDGAINTSFSGGTSPYFYTWSNGATSQNLSGIDAGGYSLNIEDANGCVTNNILVAGVPEPDSVAASSITVNCPAPGSGVSLVAIVPQGGSESGIQVSFNNGTSFQPTGDFDALLPVGANYPIVIRDNKGCTNISPLSIYVDPEVKMDNISYNVCYPAGTMTETIDVTVSGGSGSPYEVSTDGGSTFGTPGTTSFTLPIASSYNIVAMDAKGCATAAQNVILPDAFVVSVAVTSDYNGENVSCFGYSDGEATVTATGGTTAYTYAWDAAAGSQSTQIATNLGAGSYNVTVTDSKGCSEMVSAILTEPDGMSLSVVPSTNYNGYEISCFGYTDGGADLTVTGGVGPFSYSWDNGSNSQDLSNVPAGTYDIIVTDINGCTDNISTTLTEPNALTSSVAVTTNYNGFGISCYGLSDADLNLSTTGGAGSNTFNWSSGQITEDISGVAAGSYTATVTDINGCSAFATGLVTQPNALIANASPLTNFNGFNISCNGLTDGAINLTVNGGVTAYTYNWSNGATVQDPSSIGAGNYNVTVTDANGCTATASVTLTQASPLTVSLDAVSDYSGFGVSCFGYSDGFINVTASGGAGGNAYLWDNGMITADINGIGAGSYNLTVTDVNGCIATTSANLSEPAVFTANAVVTTNYNGFGVSCNGLADADIDLTTAGGGGSNTYSWNNGATTEDLTGVSAGTYAVVVTDANGCTVSDNATVTQPNVLSTSAVVSSNYNDFDISCFGEADGAINLTVNGGVPTYSYAWSNGATNQDPIGLIAGIYSVTVTDFNGCTASTSLTLTQPSEVIANVFIVSNYNGFGVSCFGDNNGFVDVNVTGGTGSYSYSWNSGALTQDLLNVEASSYTLNLSDNNGCQASVSVTLTEPGLLVATIDSVSDYNGYAVSCYGSSDGYVDLGISGGVAPYSVLWDNGATTQDLFNAEAGNYSVVMEDANGCLVAQAVSLSEPQRISLSTITGEPSCEGLLDGFIDLSISGGVPAYSILWSNNSTTEDLINIGGGRYTVVVTDQNGCVDSTTVLLTEPNTLIIGTFVRNVLCYGLSNGTIDISIEGGTEPYTYVWSTGASTQDLNNVPAGVYDLSVTDAAGCGQDFMFVVQQPDSLTLIMDPDVKFNGHNISYNNGDDGAIDITVSGGLIPYTYDWSNGATSEDVSNLTAGTYSVFILDENGCPINGTVLLTEPLPLDMPTGLSPNFDGSNDYFVIHGIEAFPDNTFSVFNRWGNLVYQKEGYNNEWGGQNLNGDILPDGTYFVIVEIKNQDNMTGYVDLRTK